MWWWPALLALAIAVLLWLAVGFGWNALMGYLGHDDLMMDFQHMHRRGYFR